MANRRYNTQVAQPRGTDRVKKAGGGMGGRSGPMMYSRGQGVNMRSKRVPTELMDRGAMKKGGSALKSVDKSKNPGLAKLPTQVRNKMGFMKDGGKVKDKTKSKKPLSGSMKKPKPGSQSYQFQQTQKPRPSQIVPKKAEGGRVNSKRMNRLEELGRVDAEKAKTSKGKINLKQEKKRIVRELKKK